MLFAVRRVQVDALCTDRVDLQKLVNELRAELVRIQSANPLRPSEKDPDPVRVPPSLLGLLMCPKHPHPTQLSRHMSSSPPPPLGP